MPRSSPLFCRPVHLYTATIQLLSRFLIPALILLLAVVSVSCQKTDIQVSLERTATSTEIRADGKTLVTYVHAETPAPPGADTINHRSAYIHPLRTPGGMVLTRIQPPGHLHQYGIFDAWTHTRIEGNPADFWNLKYGLGRTRHRSYIEDLTASGMAGFRAGHDHVYYPEAGTEKLAIEEEWELRVHDVSTDRYLLDLVSTQETVPNGGILLEQYKYGGLCYRGTADWGPHNCSVLTSEGMDWEHADSTRARWVLIEGKSTAPQGRSGILFMSHPSNREHPEPLRMFQPEFVDGTGNMYLVFTPIRIREWKLEKGRKYIRRYRMLVFDGSLGTEEAESAWSDFAGQ